MKTAVIYARYSSDKQTEQSIEGQLRVCEDYAKRNDIIITGTYIDRAMTGTNDNRPDFRKMLNDSKTQKWDYVLVYKFDRFSRNIYESVIHEYELMKRGIKLISAMENIPDAPEGIILKGLLQSMNQYYSEELAQKVRRGMNESRIKGNFMGGILPYGYKLNGKKIIIDEEKSKAIKLIFSEYSIDTTVPDIITKLTNNGWLHNGKPFKNTTIYKLLQNERYTGIYHYNGEVFDNMYPQIIDKNLFEKVRKKSNNNHIGSRSVQDTYLLRYKLTCGYCGKPISAETSRTNNKTKLNYYKCLGVKKYRNGCPKETIRQEVLEEFVINSLISKLSQPKIMNQIVEELMKIQKQENTNNSILEILKKNKKQLETNLQNIMSAIEQGIINKTTNNRMKELEEQIENIDKEIIIQENQKVEILTEEDIRKYFQNALSKQPLSLVNYLIKNIKLYNDRAEIIFNTPIKSPDNNQGFSILSYNDYLIKNVQYKTEPLFVNMQVSLCI